VAYKVELSSKSQINHKYYIVLQLFTVINQYVRDISLYSSLLIIVNLMILRIIVKKHKIKYELSMLGETS